MLAHSRRPPRAVAALAAVVALAAWAVLAAPPVASGATARAGTAGPPDGAEATGPGPLVPSGAFVWPLAGFPDRAPPARAGTEGAVTRRFLPPPHPYGRGHRGADLAGRRGLVVRAAGAGTVVFAAPLAGRGVVSVEHAGRLRTTYEPVTATVTAGAPVARAEPLGRLEPGHRGCPVAACLHWGLRRAVAGGEQYLDPLQLVGLGRARLLPSPR